MPENSDIAADSTPNPKKEKARRKGAVLVIEDDSDLCSTIQMVLEDEDFVVTCEEDGAEGLKLACKQDFDVVLTDFRLPGIGGMQILEKLQAEKPRLPVIMMTGHGSTETAIGATKRGAFDYIVKPCQSETLVEVISKAAKASHLMFKPVEIDPRGTSPHSIVGTSRAMQEVYKEIGRVAPTNVGVLILGDTGTGKELVARAIYQHSDRSEKPFIAVNCAAIPETLLESELFGHEKGSFTGAESKRLGRFEQANGGTLFLDEIGDLPLATQVKLLRVLQERSIQRLGSAEDVPVDVRVLAATHRNLEELIRENRFREDLYYRLNTVAITMPPLRDRTEDIRSLVAYFTRRAAEEYAVDASDFPEATLKVMEEYHWPGNVRQLENIVRKAILQNRGYTITAEYILKTLSEAGLPHSSQEGDEAVLGDRIASLLTEAKEAGEGKVHTLLIEEVERQLFRKAIELSHGHQSKAANWLGVSRVTLRQKLNKFGISPRDI